MLTEELMREVRRLEISTRRQVSDLFAGSYHSAFKGQGMEFAEVRAYQPGDDVRTIDWNVTARSGEPFVKRFHEERELTVMIAVDLSASGAFGSAGRFKNEAAAELCAVLGLAATRNQDRVGLVIFTDEIELHIPPRKTRSHVLRLVREVLAFEPRGSGTDLRAACESLAGMLKRRSVVFLVSDFLDDDWERSVRSLARRHDVIAAAMVDPRERSLAPAGLVELQDAETGERRVVDLSSRCVRRAFERQAAARHVHIETEMRRADVDLAWIESGGGAAEALATLFRERLRRRLR